MSSLLHRPTHPFTSPPPSEVPPDLRRAAEDGGAEAWCQLGNFLYDRSVHHTPRELNPGWTSDPDIMGAIRAAVAANEAARREAASWYRKAIAHGSIHAQYGFGRCLLMVSNSILMQAEGMAWVRQAAESGHAPAQCLMGDILQTGGYSLAKNDEEAEKWLLKAALQGEAEAQRILQGRLQSTCTAD